MWILVIHMLRNVLNASKLMWKEMRIVSLSVAGLHRHPFGQIFNSAQCIRPKLERPGPSFGKERGGRETLQPGIVSCHILLICQCSGLFLERPELAARNQTAINLCWEWNAGGGPSCTDSWDADGLEPVPEQVMEQRSNSTRYSIKASAVTDFFFWSFLKKIGFWGTEREFESNQIHFGIHVKLLLKEVSRFLQYCEMPELHGGLHLYRDTSDLTTTVSIILRQIMILLTVQLKLPTASILYLLHEHISFKHILPLYQKKRVKGNSIRRCCRPDLNLHYPLKQQNSTFSNWSLVAWSFGELKGSTLQEMVNNWKLIYWVIYYKNILPNIALVNCVTVFKALKLESTRTCTAHTSTKSSTFNTWLFVGYLFFYHWFFLSIFCMREKKVDCVQDVYGMPDIN